MRQLWTLLPFTVICLLVGYLGSLATRTSVNSWYVELTKPWWTPPDWVFGPVWTTLYLMMAVSAWLVWRQWGSTNVGLALSVFGIQLLLNLAWSFLFFGMRWPGGAAVEIVVLWLAILATIFVFSKISSVAAWLLVPYVVWVGYAAALNLAIWRANT